MMFDTLLPHAKILTENNQVGEDCFLLDYCHFGIEQFKESFDQNSKQKTPKTKLNLPVVFFGKKVKTLPGRFQGGPSANASTYTFKRKKEDQLPTDWFPWFSLKKNRMQINDFLLLMQKFNDAEPQTVHDLFTSEGSLFTFNPQKRKKMIKKQPFWRTWLQFRSIRP